MNTPKLEEILAQSGVMIIDGAMSTALEELGAELSDRLWTAKVLAQEPALVDGPGYSQDSEQKSMQ